MGPLWAEIMDNINPIVTEEDHHPLTRMAIFSAHDDTVSSLLATLGLLNDTHWPPYAAMLNLELHEMHIDGGTDRTVFASKFAFRLVYNGQVITGQVEGCLDDSELCDIKVLTDMVTPFAKRERDCSAQASYFFSTLTGDGSSGFHSFVMVLVGLALGIVGTFYCLTGSLPCCGRTKRTDVYSTRSSTLSENGMSIPPTTYTDEEPGDGNRYID